MLVSVWLAPLSGSTCAQGGQIVPREGYVMAALGCLTLTTCHDLVITSCRQAVRGTLHLVGHMIGHLIGHEIDWSSYWAGY